MGSSSSTCAFTEAQWLDINSLPLILTTLIHTKRLNSFETYKRWGIDAGDTEIAQPFLMNVCTKYLWCKYSSKQEEHVLRLLHCAIVHGACMNKILRVNLAPNSPTSVTTLQKVMLANISGYNDDERHRRRMILLIFLIKHGFNVKETLSLKGRHTQYNADDIRLLAAHVIQRQWRKFKN